jgi:hypothetical protein
MTEIAMTSPSDAQPTSDPLTTVERLFVASRLLARARHESKKLLNVERNQKILHPKLVKSINEDIAECTRIALKLQGGSNG